VRNISRRRPGAARGGRGAPRGPAPAPPPRPRRGCSPGRPCLLLPPPGAAAPHDRERRWPHVRIAWQVLPLPAAVRAAVHRATIAVGFQQTTRAGVLGAAEPNRGQTERSFPLQAALGFGGGLSLSYTGGPTRGGGYDPTGRTEHRASQHALQLSGSFRAPAALATGADQPVRASLRFDQRTQHHCRVRAESVLCTPYVDAVHRSLDLTLETVVSDLDLGVQMSYIERTSRIGAGNGYGNFQLNLFARFQVAAGALPGAVR
jgi:hypothetical protein